MNFKLKDLDKIVEQAHERLDAFADFLEASLETDNMKLAPVKIKKR